MSKEKNLYDILRTSLSVTTINGIAKKLFLSEPYISKLLKQTEEKYHVILLNRNQKPIQLTKAGEIFLKDLRTILESQNELNYDLEPYQDNKEYEIRIAFNQPWLETQGKSIITFLMRRFPEITFSFFEQTTNLAQDNLLNHSLDVFVGKVLVNRHISSTYFTDSKLSFLVPESSPLFQIQARTLTPAIFKHFDNQKFISLTDDSFFQVMVDHMFAENEVILNKVVKVANSLISNQLAYQGLGYTIAAKNNTLFTPDQQKVKIINIPENMLQLNNGVSYLNDSSKMVHKVGKELLGYLKRNKELMS